MCSTLTLITGSCPGGWLPPQFSYMLLQLFIYIITLQGLDNACQVQSITIILSMNYHDASPDIEELFQNFRQRPLRSFPRQSPFNDFNLSINSSVLEHQMDYHLENRIFEKGTKCEGDKGPTQGPGKKKRVAKLRYEKNIGGYILKKVFSAFVSEIYRGDAISLCQKHSVRFEQVRKICLQKMEKLNGIAHLHRILMPATKEQVGSKQVLVDFIEWFVKERYLRVLILEGKMCNKERYITFKNIFFPREISCVRGMIEEFAKRQQDTSDIIL